VLVARGTGQVDGSGFCASVQRASGSTGVGTIEFAYPIDTSEITRLRGSQVVLRFWARAGNNWSPASGSLSLVLACGTGPAAKRGTTPLPNEVMLINTSVGLTPNTEGTHLFTSALTVPSNATSAELQFYWVPTGTAGTDDWVRFDDVMLCRAAPGTGQPLFDRSDFWEDLERCKPFFETSYAYGEGPAAPQPASSIASWAVPSTINNGQHFSNIVFARKRVRPTVTVFSYNGVANRVSDGAAVEYTPNSSTVAPTQCGASIWNN